MQKIISVILIVGLGLLLVNLIWTVSISQNISEVLSRNAAKTGFTRTVEELKDSRVVERFTFVARGNIQDIENRTLTLEYGGSILRIPVATDAQIVKQTEMQEIPETISFQDLKVGDEVSCLVEMDKEGGWGAYRVKMIVGGVSQ